MMYGDRLNAPICIYINYLKTNYLVLIKSLIFFVLHEREVLMSTEMSQSQAAKRRGKNKRIEIVFIKII